MNGEAGFMTRPTKLAKKASHMFPQYPELEEYFRNIDHYDIKSIIADTRLRAFIAGMLSYYPWWIVALFRIREIMVRVLGLAKHEKPEAPPCLKPEDVSFTPGQNASFFIVRQAKENTYWVAETPEDKHLSAYFGVFTEELENHRSKFHVFTTLRYKHWSGPVYFNIIRPFHHLVVAKMMKAGATRSRRNAALPRSRT
jgi:hypothetical protein